MSYGLQVDGFNFTYGTYSVIEKGLLTQTTVVTKANHPDIRLWGVFYVPVGVRDTSRNELRPSTVETGTTITMQPPTTVGNGHLYFVLGR